MQIHRDQADRTLDLLYAAERARDAAPAGSPAWRSANAEAQAIREAYLRAGQAPLSRIDVAADQDDEPETSGADAWLAP